MTVEQQDRATESAIRLRKWPCGEAKLRELFWREASQRAQETQRIATQWKPLNMCCTTDTARRLVPAQPLPLNRCASAIKTLIKLWAVSCRIKKSELNPARNQLIGGAGFKEIPGVDEELVELWLRLLFAGGALNELRRVPGNGTALQAVAEPEPDATRLHLRHDVKGAAGGEGNLKFRERLHAATEATRRLTYPLRDRLELAAVRRKEGEDAIRLT